MRPAFLMADALGVRVLADDVGGQRGSRPPFLGFVQASPELGVHLTEAGPRPAAELADDLREVDVERLAPDGSDVLDEVVNDA